MKLQSVFGLFQLATALSISDVWDAKLGMLSGQTVLSSGFAFDTDIKLLKLHKDMVEINSIAPYEEEVGAYLKKYLKAKGLTVETQVVSQLPYRANIYAYLGSQRDNRICITSHMDTVPPYLPYYVEDNKIYGRGTCDAKGSVASQIVAYLDLVKDGTFQEGDASLLFVVGEEVDGSGMVTVSRALNTTWESVIFGEPTELKLGVGHKGNYYFSLHSQGKASHSGYPELGVNANTQLIRVLNRLLDLDLPKHDLLGPSTINVGVINGGIAANVIPAEASARVFIRVADGLEEIAEMVQKAISSEPNIEMKLIQRVDQQFLDYEVPGFESIVLAYATDIPYLKGSFKRYLYGPGTIHVAHAANEFVTIEDLLEAVAGYKKLAKFTLGK
ncbi:hypothetical protein BABINDRAFT_81614 [Babjeviella inositovora NRRL Y-12698]|uniref:Peptidase M20 dimerisation domain-containing protein n=1 Tax=Babjeviella inositovora NRRL Y-12698 TaxID=984486 RepID=A0A1E3QZS6_9ASCO|nr:uncharacterized protein BABINDRAFT_81614 [Babjeviella inositovora NRRL Y-12698]ODQ83148.1 hypothetical protein BABINDRAFT_81614 [Babjeviella inositovora NRRL Y-12698]